MKEEKHTDSLDEKKFQFIYEQRSYVQRELCTCHMKLYAFDTAIQYVDMATASVKQFVAWKK